jgi:hypothetical protein
MDPATFFMALQNSGIAQWVNTAGATYPIVESLHVIAIALVFGTILIVDLRLVGLASTSRPFTLVAHDLLKLTWIGFALAVMTGVLLFLPNASNLYVNVQFQVKMVLLLLAGINMFIFEMITARNVASWNVQLPPPTAARVAGTLSIALWLCVIVFGRLIGFASVADDPFAFI